MWQELTLGWARTGHRIAAPKRHSCEYVARRNALIAEAERVANERVHVIAHDSGNGRRLTRKFVKALNELAAPLLRQSDNAAHIRKPSKLRMDHWAVQDRARFIAGLISQIT